MEKQVEQEYTVEFEVMFRTKVKCKKEDLSDRISDINIPESEEVEYVSDSLLNVSDKDGKDVDVGDEN